MICSCGLELRDHEWHCPNCLQDHGAPNVRAARRREERDALLARHYDALQASPLAVTLHHAMASSVVVICRAYAQLLDLLQSDNELYASFYQLIESEKRRPSASAADRDRRAADSLFFSYFERDIRFGALSLDGLGAVHYGPAHLVLASRAIHHRCSFFHENTVEFARRHGLGPGRAAPPGYRADWDHRGELAVAKHASQILPGTTPEEYPGILLDGDDFIEAHIFGPLHRRALERIILLEPRRAADKAYVDEILSVIDRDQLSISVEFR